MTSLTAKRTLGLPARTTTTEALAECKRQLIQARRCDDDDRAKTLSQVRQVLKLVRRCVDCGVTLATTNSKHTMRCSMHNVAYRQRRRWGRSLAA